VEKRERTTGNLRIKDLEMKQLKVGDIVMWRGGFGSDSPCKAKVVGIEVCRPGEKYGEPRESVDWNKVNSVVVDLENGHWAKGHQLSPL
jgi:hypothetical protein